jgi:hypothetical protein
VKVVREFERSLARGKPRTDFRVVHYSLQGNHAHLLVEARDRGALGRGMKSVGNRLMWAVNRAFERRGPVLADRYHLRVLRTPLEVKRALAYVLLNARRHGRPTRGRASGDPDPASSGRWFDGWTRASGQTAASESPPVARPHTWLLRRGWRRYGLIDPGFVPGGP